jgi:hypothetical protein
MCVASAVMLATDLPRMGVPVHVAWMITGAVVALFVLAWMSGFYVGRQSREGAESNRDPRN